MMCSCGIDFDECGDNTVCCPACGNFDIYGQSSPIVYYEPDDDD